MKKLWLLACIISFFAAKDLSAQTVTTQFVQVTTIESVIGAGIGRSKMIITREDGSQEEREMENLFSIGGINFKNIKKNETDIIQTLKSYTDKGWKLYSTTPLTLSPGTNGAGIFMTRYLLIKESGNK